MANITHKMNLSTTEPNNDVGLIKVRQADDETQIFDVTVTESGAIKPFVGLTPFFCLMAREITGQGVSEERVGTFYEHDGRLCYTLSANAFQMLGRNEAYFSFRTETKDGRWIEQFSTRTFLYTVEKSIYTQPFKDSNYLVTFKELYRMITRIIEEGQLDWDSFIDRNREILESVDPGGKILEELIDARNDFESLGERLDNEYKDFSVNTNLDIGATVLSVFEPLVAAMKDTVEKLDAGTFKMGFLTDAHYSDMTGFDWFKDQYRSLNHVTNFHEALGNSADALVYGGDNVANESPNIAINTKAQEIFSSKVFDTIMNADRFMLLGNHDNYVPLPTTPDVIFQPIENVYSDEDYSGFYRANQLLFDEQRENGNSLYFYKDYPEKNIRLIGLNTNDNPRVVDSEGKIKYNYNQSLGILQPQIDWLYSVLRETPAEYHTIVVSHSPLTSSNDYNSDLVVGMLKAFKNGTTYQDLRTAEDWEAQVSADFTEQGPRKLIGVFSGHLHQEIFSGLDDEIHQVSLNSSWFKGQSNRAVADKENTNLEDCWYLISVNTTEARVNIYGFDAGNNFEYVY